MHDKSTLQHQKLTTVYKQMQCRHDRLHGGVAIWYSSSDITVPGPILPADETDPNTSQSPPVCIVLCQPQLCRVLQLQLSCQGLRHGVIFHVTKQLKPDALLFWFFQFAECDLNHAHQPCR